jgi:hypothetical protein
MFPEHVHPSVHHNLPITFLPEIGHSHVLTPLFVPRYTLPVHSYLSSCSAMDSNLRYAVLSAHALINNVHVLCAHDNSYVFDVAVPCLTQDQASDQTILTCSLRFRSLQKLDNIPSGVYRIHAKVSVYSSQLTPL